MLACGACESGPKISLNSEPAVSRSTTASHFSLGVASGCRLSALRHLSSLSSMRSWIGTKSGRWSTK